MDIVVLAGGYSHEREVSMSSGSLIANALMKNGHRVILLDLYFGTDEATTFDEAYKKLSKDTYDYKVKRQIPDMNALRALKEKPDEMIGHNVIPIAQSADLVFLSLHGELGENGQLQAVFDLYDITYTGTGYIGSALAMNKILAKEVMSQYGIPTPKWEVLGKDETPETAVPCVVKPDASGSSIGVYLVEKEEDLDAAITDARKYSKDVLIEEMIQGREFSIGVLEDQALPPIEIIPKSGFYDYENKYQEGATVEICPAEISEELTTAMQDMAKRVFKALRLEYYARIDFMVSDSEDVYCIEANTLPGMTPTSLFPQEAAAAGITYNELCDRLAQLAADKRK
ncbi:D-alanine-D-alanine ligase [Alkalibacterium putridalgicola]|uniref:D-alanine--D-alanine ligase n=1 Tax=Alkalibacterium putridalgicola TaxID=426703 RepID=A0A1H7TC30_9LACT|nr:D-alanine--D-alanine ligase [Alkalibacterium putridalgicola]GEK89303.1 D-alanine--D-alanine ligase [Alkalibacterium putridalgicola]SEL81397.1 D-alanine-D-alanine ligase [Alkalibacterium putridalgicola]